MRGLPLSCRWTLWLTQIDISKKVLQRIFTDAFNLVKDYFLCDVDPNGSLPQELKSYKFVKGKITLSPENSLPAKQARVSAVMIVLGRAMEKHIFRPIYLLRDDADFVELLSEAALENPVREAYLRAVLLGVMPGRQKEIRESRAAATATKVIKYVRSALPANKVGAFDEQLQGFCTRAAEEWMELQKTPQRLRACFAAPREPLAAKRWKRLFQATASEAQVDDKAPSPQPDDSTAANGTAHPVAASPPLLWEDVKAVLWPAFVTVQADNTEALVIQGAVLTVQQVMTGPARERRRASRELTGSAARMIGSTGGGEPALSKESFLSHGDGTRSERG